MCSSDLVDDMVTVDEDNSVVVDIFDNDTDLPSNGTLTTTKIGRASCRERV